MGGTDRTATVRRGVRLGVDVGSVRVGLAACDPDGMIATAVETLARDTRNPTPADIERIAAECDERDVIEVVVGLPLSLSGRGGAASDAARQYAGRIARRVAPVTVRLVDERLTTVSAHQALRDAGRAGRKQRSVVDQVAAVMILQQALDMERSTGREPGSLVTATEKSGGL